MVYVGTGMGDRYSALLVSLMALLLALVGTVYTYNEIHIHLNIKCLQNNINLNSGKFSISLEESSTLFKFHISYSWFD